MIAPGQAPKQEAAEPWRRPNGMLAAAKRSAHACPGVRCQYRMDTLRWIVLLLAVMALATLLAVSANADESSDAEAYIAKLRGTAIDQVITTDIEQPERMSGSRALISLNLDVEAIARLVLGRHWHAATEEERLAFLEVIQESLVRRSMVLIAEYSGERLIVGYIHPVSVDPMLSTVLTPLARPGSAAVKVEWRVHQTGDGYRIVDVIAEGVSMALTLRAKYHSCISGHGGSMNALIRALCEKLPAELVHDKAHG